MHVGKLIFDNRGLKGLKGVNFHVSIRQNVHTPHNVGMKVILTEHSLS